MCKKLHGTVFEKYIINAITDRCNLISSIGSHEKQQPSCVGYVSIGGGNAISSNLTTEALDSIGENFYFID